MARRVKIVTDSAADLSPDVAKELDITVLPIKLHLDGETLLDGIDTDAVAFNKRLQQSAIIPYNTGPSVEEFEKTYNELSKKTDHILSIHVSRKLSSTYSAAKQATSIFLGRSNIAVVDSLSVSHGLGTLVTAAAEAAQTGQTLDDILKLIRGIIPHIYIVFFVESLHYLEHGKRIGAAEAILGTMLQIKPLLMIEDGDIQPLEKVKTRELAIEKLYEFAVEFSEFEEIAILQNYPDEETDELIERIQTVFPEAQIPIHEYGPVLAAHLGPGAMGIMVYENIDAY